MVGEDANGREIARGSRSRSDRSAAIDHPVLVPRLQGIGHGDRPGAALLHRLSGVLKIEPASLTRSTNAQAAEPGSRHGFDPATTAMLDRVEDPETRSLLRSLLAEMAERPER